MSTIAKMRETYLHILINATRIYDVLSWECLLFPRIEQAQKVVTPEGFEPSPPERPAPEAGALDHSARVPSVIWPH